MGRGLPLPLIEGLKRALCRFSGKKIHFEMENFGAFAVVLTIHLNFRQSRATLNYRQIAACEQTASLESVQGSGTCHA